MMRLAVATAVMLVLASLSAIGAAADTEYCVTEDLGRCGDNIPRLDPAAEVPETIAVDEVSEVAVEDSQTAATPDDAAALPPEQPQSPVTTRTIGPPMVVNPFAATAAPAAAQAEPVAPFSRPADQPRLPPGPPNRFP